MFSLSLSLSLAVGLVVYTVSTPLARPRIIDHNWPSMDAKNLCIYLSPPGRKPVFYLGFDKVLVCRGFHKVSTLVLNKEANNIVSHVNRNIR